MPPIVSDGQLSHPPADPTSFTATELAAAVGGRVVRAGSVAIRGGAVDSRLVAAGPGVLRARRVSAPMVTGTSDAAVEAGAAALVIRDPAERSPDLAGAIARDADVEHRRGGRSRDGPCWPRPPRGGTGSIRSWWA